MIHSEYIELALKLYNATIDYVVNHVKGVKNQETYLKTAYDNILIISKSENIAEALGILIKNQAFNKLMYNKSSYNRPDKYSLLSNDHAIDVLHSINERFITGRYR